MLKRIKLWCTKEELGYASWVTVVRTSLCHRDSLIALIVILLSLLTIYWLYFNYCGESWTHASLFPYPNQVSYKFFFLKELLTVFPLIMHISKLSLILPGERIPGWQRTACRDKRCKTAAGHMQCALSCRIAVAQTVPAVPPSLRETLTYNIKAGTLQLGEKMTLLTDNLRAIGPYCCWICEKCQLKYW